ncbi:MAG: DUF1638 domain-containing protein [Proteobacteria bacterium]|nr:DUF1638 domain-containing protein [Pseudomonadota bacterium]MBU1714576.1 DUF1638 domain-containing protein [Pseudomonadota bacterium]
MNTDTPITLVACEIFADELPAFLHKNGRNYEVVWLEAALHTDITKLKSKLECTLSSLADAQKRTCILYGNSCLPDAKELFSRHGAQSFSACNCIEAFLGREEKQKYEAEGCFIMTPGWVRAWPSIITSLGWDAIDVRMNLGRYTKILVFDPVVNPLTDEEVINFFDLTGLFVETLPLSLSHFDRLITNLLSMASR